MEKIFIKPVAKEIVIKGSRKDGPIDLFSYDSEADHSRRQLGNLYVVGNIQAGDDEPSGDDLDVAYVINLIASLAKREYYAQPDAAVKDAFSSALKKINGVVEEFFKKKDTKINIGIFAVAGGEIHISKLGKFKILLARDNKTIDILNNIELFNKESTQEKEFSNIISGKIHEGDRILAYYPNRAVVAREKSIKESFLKSSQDEFAAVLASVKEDKPEFGCAALHIDMQKGTETADAKRIQPRELREEHAKTPEATVQLAGMTDDEEDKDADDDKNKDTDADEESEDTEEPPVVIPPVKPMPVRPTPKAAVVSENRESSRIIPSEFSLGKKQLPLVKNFHQLKNMNISPRNKMIAMGGVAVLIIVAVISLKSFIFISPNARALNAAVAQAQADLKSAQSKIASSDLVGAHSLLVGALSSLAETESKDGSSSSADSATNNITKALDSLDQAVDTNPVLVPGGDIPTSSGTATLLTSSGSNFYVYLDQGSTDALAEVTSSGISQSTPVSNLSPTGLFSSDDYISLVDPASKSMASLSIAKSTLAATSISISDSIIDSDVFSDNLYALTATGITKVADAASGHTTTSDWLSSGTSLKDPALITVDGNVYVLSTDGTLTTYYKGAQTAQVATPIAADANTMMLLSTTTGQNLYVVDKTLGRIYELAKSTGSLVKTLKINASEPITTAAIGADETIYILSDNKIWSVQ